MARDARATSPTFRQIEAFRAVIATGGVTKAAHLLGLTQPAVSRLVADLETTVGFPLFLRTARTLMPTQKARALHREVERSFLGMEHIAATARALAAGEREQLRLAVLPSLVSHFTKEILAPFAAAHPGVAVSLEVHATLDAAELLDSVYCDIGITNEPVQPGRLDAIAIGRTTAVCVMARRHRLARAGGTLRPADLAGSRFVSFMPGGVFRRRVDRAFEDAGIVRDLRYEARTTAAACEMAVALGAVAIVPALPESGDQRLVVKPFEPAMESDLVLVKHRARALPPIAEAFVAFARARAAGKGRASDSAATRGDAPAPARAAKTAVDHRPRSR